MALPYKKKLNFDFTPRQLGRMKIVLVWSDGYQMILPLFSSVRGLSRNGERYREYHLVNYTDRGWTEEMKRRFERWMETIETAKMRPLQDTYTIKDVDALLNEQRELIIQHLLTCWNQYATWSQVIEEAPKPQIRKL